MNKDKIEDILWHIVVMHRRTEKIGGNGIKEFLEANKDYKFKAETIRGIKKAIINFEEKFEINIL